MTDFGVRKISPFILRITLEMILKILQKTENTNAIYKTAKLQFCKNKSNNKQD